MFIKNKTKISKKIIEIIIYKFKFHYILKLYYFNLTLQQKYNKYN
jgi:hypothetical protein